MTSSRDSRNAFESLHGVRVYSADRYAAAHLPALLSSNRAGEAVAARKAGFSLWIPKSDAAGRRRSGDRIGTRYLDTPIFRH
jgi:hypothetical protein